MTYSGIFNNILLYVCDLNMCQELLDLVILNAIYYTYLPFCFLSAFPTQSVCLFVCLFVSPQGYMLFEDRNVCCFV